MIQEQQRYSLVRERDKPLLFKESGKTRGNSIHFIANGMESIRISAS